MGLNVPMFPLSMVVFPHQMIGLIVFEPRYRTLLDDIDLTQEFGTCLITRGSEVGGGDERTSVGTWMRVRGVQRFPDGKAFLAVEGVKCIRVDGWLPDDPYPRAEISERCCEDVMINPDLLGLAETSVRALRTLQSEVTPDEVAPVRVEMAEDPWERAWQLCAMTPMATFDQFKVLSLENPNDRLVLLNEICCERYGDYQRILAMGPPGV
ncbi:MAG: LON peptidase substrate-binding domain-containing protein [Acidimicrobiaceae bacterium]|nr:LON peptidase substrate-binding domain-containing protein [Acidimicrobiaceae bacterium]